MLIDCAECGGRISTSAPHCPHCGAPNLENVSVAAPSVLGGTSDPIEACHYCKSRPAPDKSKHHQRSLYWITKRRYVPLGYEYAENVVSVPRCDRCFEIHSRSSGGALLICAPVGYGAISWWALSSGTNSSTSDWVSTFLFVIVLGTPLTGALMWVCSAIASSNAGTLPESSIQDYSPVTQLLKSGWLMNKPDPGSMPDTSDERRRQT